MLTCLLACLLLFWSVTFGLAADVTLAWEASTSPNIVDYRLHTRLPDGSTPAAVSLGNVTTTVVHNVPASGTTTYGVTAVNNAGVESTLSNTVQVTLGTIPQAQLTVVSFDSQELVGENGAATNAIDGKTTTFWHSEWKQHTAPLPHTLTVDLGASSSVDGFIYLPRQDGQKGGTILTYEFYVSPDGTTWGTAVAKGTWAKDTTAKTVRFTAKTGRYVRLVGLTEIMGDPYTSAAELTIYGTGSTPTPAGQWLLVVGAADVAWQYRDRLPSETQCRTIAQAKQQAETRAGAVWNCLEESRQNLVVTPKVP
jgi:F5/8 type C domain